MEALVSAGPAATGAGRLRPGPEPAYRIGLSQCTAGDAWRQAMRASMEKELSFHPNVQFEALDAHDNTALQRRQVQALIRQRVDLLIISPNQSGPLTDLNCSSLQPRDSGGAAGPAHYFAPLHGLRGWQQPGGGPHGRPLRCAAAAQARPRAGSAGGPGS
ncbi:hypothetical protein [Hymenobacter coccineus]|uniref:hypothetical protein n=1 Tax=Hymenobacter coccineus TaxID=1908235 RepID=UPI001300F95C|nr:hypothetical protein [Hymenobacter coccineus]